MKKIDFWSGLFHGGLNDIRVNRINDAASHINSLRRNSKHRMRSMRELFRKHRVQSKEIANLRKVVDILTELLVASGHLDANELRMRIEQELTTFEPEPLDDDAGPYRGYGTQPPPTNDDAGSSPSQSTHTVACYVCDKMVLQSDTMITAKGLVCDPCYGTRRIRF